MFKEFYFYRAAYYYLFNRLAYYGITFNTNNNKTYRYDEIDRDYFFNHAEIMRTRRVIPQKNRMKLVHYKLLNIDVHVQDYKKTFKQHPKAFMYCNPPYYKIENLYKADGFNHKSLAKILKNRKNWIASYNDVPEIHELYNGNNMLPLTMRSGFRRQGKRQVKKELLIFSDDIYENFQKQPKQLSFNFK